MLALSALAAIEPVTLSTTAVRPEQRQFAISAWRATGASSLRPFAPICSFSVGDAYDAGQGRRLHQGAVRHRAVRRRAHRPRGRRRLITVVENPVINQVAFEGNSEVDKATLRNEVQLKPRSVFTRARSRPTCSASSTSIAARAALRRPVEPKIIELEQDRVNLVFEINEGSATKVKGINFVGNHAFSD